MDAANLKLAADSRLVSQSYVEQGGQSLSSHHQLVRSLLASRRLPEQGWEEATIEMLINVSYQCNTCFGHSTHAASSLQRLEARL